MLTSKALLNVESVTFKSETLRKAHIYPGFYSSEQKTLSVEPFPGM